ncbi:N-formylglutamate amidohydrolase [Solihabitans fulvus]|uniref:N-formylglutamate amidohydrolase n=1 Tax=Solihabitans fulvus TaxID=1892852 RepID=UPI001CB76463|nr:N-formylglutamate amidohydrolase [Solihabitans fulvus]
MRTEDTSGPRFRVTPGDAGSPVILHVPHGARAIPPSARERIVLDDDELSRELDHLTDAHTGLIAARAAHAARTAPWTFANLLSRLVIDPERFPDDREEMRSVGMGAVYLRTSHGAVLREDDPVHVEDLLARHYRPYAAAMTDLVRARLAEVGHVVIIDVHSYPSAALPYELHASDNRPAVCLGVDPFHTPERLRDAAFDAFARCGDLDVNTPFAGCYVPLEHYGTVREVSALMVEIRRDGYLVEPGGEPTAGIDTVVRALTALVDAIS